MPMIYLYRKLFRKLLNLSAIITSRYGVLIELISSCVGLDFVGCVCFSLSTNFQQFFFLWLLFN
jgi:hypothetical protein